MRRPDWYEPPVNWRDDPEEERKRAMSDKLETRFVPRPHLRAAVADDGVRRLSGYAAKYSILSGDIGAMQGGSSWYEKILPGAFDSVLAKNPDVRLTLAHDPVNTYARTVAGTLQLRSDKVGLRFDATLPETQAARDLHENIRVGNLTECSFVFQNPICEWTKEKDKNGQSIDVRNISAFGNLKDVCVTPTGAYPNTEVHARAVRDAADDESIEDDIAEDEWDLFGPDYDPTSETENHCDNGDCDDARCGCQNRMCRSMSAVDAFHDTLLDRSARRAGPTTNIRTKRVDGKDLPASAFAFVGDPDETETWKLPIHDANHVRNALARFDQTEGLGDKKAEAKAKILAAAKRFGIDAAGDRSSRLIAVSNRIIRDFEKERQADAARERRKRLFNALVMG